MAVILPRGTLNIHVVIDRPLSARKAQLLYVDDDVFEAIHRPNRCTEPLTGSFISLPLQNFTNEIRPKSPCHSSKGGANL